MKQILIYFITVLFSITFAFETEARGFVAGFEDIPLMEGLKQTESDDIVFGNEETSYREAQLVAVRKKSFKDIQDFYLKTLPQLGWNIQSHEASSLKFSRENEILEIGKISDVPLKISISLKNKN